MSTINGFTVGYTVAGAIVLWSGLKDATVSNTVRALMRGSTSPPQNQSVSSGSPGTSTWNGPPSSTASTAGYKAFARLALAKHGWTSSAEWSAFSNVVVAESGWNANAKNPSTGAYGIAQALGHGNANTAAPDGENNYGGYGTSDSVAKLANEGSGPAQIEWMCNYIAQAYGDPVKAWAYHQANNSY